MKCKYHIFILFCLLISSTISAQYDDFYIPTWNENLGVEKYKFDKELSRITESLDTLKNLNPEDLEYEEKRGLRLIGILNSYKNCKVSTDTIYHYANKISNISLKNFCSYWDYFLRQLVIGEGKRVIYFVEERPDLWEKYCEKCRLYYESREDKSIEEVQKNDYYLALVEIEKKDVLYRKDEVLDWEKQNILDSQNRVSLDSLYNIYGFPTKVALNGRKSSCAWLLLQHSEDCDWVKKWIERFLDARMDGYTISNPLSNTFIRFFDPQNGYCQNSESFIKLLKSKYPDSFAKSFGYDKFYE